MSAAMSPVAYRTPLHQAHALMREALALLDAHSVSAAAADLDSAIHRLEREMAEVVPIRGAVG